MELRLLSAVLSNKHGKERRGQLTECPCGNGTFQVMRVHRSVFLQCAACKESFAFKGKERYRLSE